MSTPDVMRIGAAGLEWLRLWRTGRLIVLLVVFALFGLLGPLTAAYLPEILGAATQAEGVVVELPEPVPADGLVQYVGNVSQLGLLAVVVVAAMALAVDAKPGLATFYRTRQPVAWRLVLPRWVASTLAVVAAWTLGLLAAWYETVLLIGDVAPQAIAIGWLLWALYLAFAVAVVALAAGLARSTIAVSAMSLAFLLGLALVGLIPPIAEWLPSRLVGAPASLAAESTSAGDYTSAALVTAVATAGALVGAAWLLARRERSA